MYISPNIPKAHQMSKLPVVMWVTRKSFQTKRMHVRPALGSSPAILPGVLGVWRKYGTAVSGGDSLVIWGEKRTKIPKWSHVCTKWHSRHCKVCRNCFSRLNPLWGASGVCGPSQPHFRGGVGWRQCGNVVSGGPLCVFSFAKTRKFRNCAKWQNLHSMRVRRSCCFRVPHLFGVNFGVSGASQQLFRGCT